METATSLYIPYKVSESYFLLIGIPISSHVNSILSLLFLIPLLRILHILQKKKTYEEYRMFIWLSNLLRPNSEHYSLLNIIIQMAGRTSIPGAKEK